MTNEDFVFNGKIPNGASLEGNIAYAKSFTCKDRKFTRGGKL